MSTASSTRARRRVPESRRERGLLDTSVVIGLARADRSQLPAEMSLSAITLAEPVTGPHATDDVEERARRQDRLQRAQRTFDAIPFDADAAKRTDVCTRR
jgi:predicted nucleic acid-binding protein